MGDKLLQEAKLHLKKSRFGSYIQYYDRGYNSNRGIFWKATYCLLNNKWEVRYNRRIRETPDNVIRNYYHRIERNGVFPKSTKLAWMNLCNYDNDYSKNHYERRCCFGPYRATRQQMINYLIDNIPSSFE